MALSKLTIYLACIMALAIMAGKGVGAHESPPEDYVNAHNSARDAVGVSPVTWDDTVAAYAKNYADQRTGDCELIHSNGPYGENLFWGSSGTHYSGVDGVKAWVSEGQDYDYYSNTCAEGKVCGNYTQVVWSSSISIGCARVKCNDGAIFIICNYCPPGNVIGKRPY